MSNKPKIDAAPIQLLWEVAPQAIFWRPIQYFSKDPRTEIDDFDSYRGASFRSGNSLTFELRKYYGHPDDTTTLYLGVDVREEEIHQIIDVVILGLEIPFNAVAWRRGWDFQYGHLERNRKDRLLEREARILTLKVAGTQPGFSASTTFVKSNIRNFTNLTEIDLQQSASRPKEKLWQQIVGNVVSHNSSSKSIFSMGYAAHIDGMISLTDNGVNYLKSIGFLES